MKYGYGKIGCINEIACVYAVSANFHNAPAPIFVLGMLGFFRNPRGQLVPQNRPKR